MKEKEVWARKVLRPAHGQLLFPFSFKRSKRKELSANKKKRKQAIVSAFRKRKISWHACFLSFVDCGQLFIFKSSFFYFFLTTAWFLFFLWAVVNERNRKRKKMNVDPDMINFILNKEKAFGSDRRSCLQAHWLPNLCFFF